MKLNNIFLSLIYTYFNLFFLFLFKLDYYLFPIFFILNYVFISIFSKRFQDIEIKKLSISLGVTFIVLAITIYGARLLSPGDFLDYRFIGNYIYLVYINIIIFILTILFLGLNFFEENKKGIFSKKIFSLLLFELINVIFIIITMAVLMGIGFNRYGGL